MATYYVSPTGDDSNDGLTELTPFLTIQKAVDSIVPIPLSFNQIRLADGIYNNGFTCADKSFNLVCASNNPNNVQIIGSGSGVCFDYTRTLAASQNGISLVKITISGFETLIKLTDTNPPTRSEKWCSFQEVIARNQKIESNFGCDFLFLSCDLQGVEFVYNTPTNTLMQCAPVAFTNCNLQNTKNVLAFNSLINPADGLQDGRFSSNNCRGAEIVINDLVGRGYSYLHTLHYSNTINNYFDGAKVKFFDSNPTIADLAGLSYATVYSLTELQNKMNTDLGGGTVYADSFLFDVVTNLYIDPNGNDTTGNGTPENPYFSPGRAAQDIPQGSPRDFFTVHAAAGTYNFTSISQGSTDDKAFTLQADGSVVFSGIGQTYGAIDCTTPNTAAVRYVGEIQFVGFSKLFDLSGENTDPNFLFTFENCNFSGQTFAQENFDFFEFIDCDFSGATSTNISSESIEKKGVYSAVNCDFSNSQGFVFFGSSVGQFGDYSNNKFIDLSAIVNVASGTGLPNFADGQNNSCANFTVSFETGGVFSDANAKVLTRVFEGFKTKARLDADYYSIDKYSFVFAPSPSDPSEDSTKNEGGTVPRSSLGNLRPKSSPPFELVLTKQDGTQVRTYLSNEPKPQFSSGIDGDTGDISVFVTRSFTIPRNPINDEFFELFTHFNVQSTIIKRELNCTLLYRGEIIADKTKITEFSYDAKNYNISISGNNAILIDLASKKISELDFSDLDFIYPAAPDFTQTSGDKLFLRFFGKLNSVLDIDLMATPPPAISLKTIYDRILSENGITHTFDCDFNFYDSFDFQNKYLQLGSFIIAGIDQTTAAVYQFSTRAAGIYYIITPTGGIDNNFVNFQGNWIDIQAKGIYDFIFTKVQNTGAHTMYMEVDDLNIYEIYEIFATDVTTTFSLALEVDTKIRVYIDKVGASQSSLYYNFKVTAKNTTTQIYSKYFISPNLPDVTQIEVLKFITKRYGLFVDYEPSEKILTFKDLQAFENNFKSDLYVDISDYIVSQNDAKIDFVGRNAQTNYYEYKNTDNVGKEIARGVLELENVNIEPERTAYEAPFAASFTTGAGAISVESVDATSGEFKPFAARLVSVASGKVGGVSNAFAVQFLGTDRHNPEYSIEWQDALDAYYSAQKRTLLDFKILELKAVIPFKVLQKIVNKYTAIPVVVNLQSAKYGQIVGIFKVVDATFYESAASILKLLILSFETSESFLGSIPYQWGGASVVLDDGLVDFLINQGTMAKEIDTNVNQPVAADRPQFGYDKVGAYVAGEGLTYDGSNLVSNWANKETNGRALGALVQSDNAKKPLWNSTEGCLVFNEKNVLLHTFSAKNIPVLTANIVAQFAAMTTSVTIGNWFVLFRVGKNDGLILFLMRSNTDQVMLRVALGISVGYYIDKRYTFAEFNALFTNKTSITVVFNNSKLEVFVNASRILSGTAPSNPLIVQIPGAYDVIRNSLALNGNKIFSLQVFESALTNNEILLLHQNNPTYFLPRRGIVAVSADLISGALPAATYNKLSVGLWIYVPSSYNPTADQSFQIFGTKTGVLGWGVTIAYTHATTTFVVSFNFGSGVSNENITQSFTKTAFLANFAGLWAFFGGAFGFGTKQLYIKTTGYPSAAAGVQIITEPTPNIITILSSATPAGIRIERAWLYPNKRFSADDFAAKVAKDKNEITFLNN